MGPANSAGPGAPDLSAPELADPAELRRRIDAGEWVVDLRTRSAFAAGHLAGTLNFGLDGQFVTYLGWLIPWGAAVTLLGETAEQVAEAQRELVRIGIDRPAAMATGKPEDWAGGDAAGVATRSPRSPTSPPSCARTPRSAGRARRAPRPGVRRVAHRRRGAHPDPRVLAPPRRRPRRPALGALRRRLPRQRRRRRCSHARGHDVVAVDDAFDNAAPSAGLPLTTRTTPDEEI